VIHVPHVRVVADAAPEPSTRPTIPAPVDPAVEYLDQLARAAITFAGTYAPGNVAARRMAESVASELRRLAIAAGVPGGERVGASIAPLMPSAPSTEAR
jgi:hypothetical protein